MSSAVFFHLQAFLILLIFYYGVYIRKNRALHPKVMLTAIIWDLILVLQIELNRGAIAKATKVATNAFILNFHVSIAVSTVLLYFIVGYLGYKLLQGDRSFRKAHITLGIITLLLRTSTFITSFMI